MFELLALLREARRQKGLPAAELPEICILDPDDDIVRCLKDSGGAKRGETWPCFTPIYIALSLRDKRLASLDVRAPFSVLVADRA